MSSFCKHLTQHENEVVFQMLGAGRESKVTAIVRLYIADQLNQWRTVVTGVGCYVKDFARRGFYIQVKCCCRLAEFLPPLSNFSILFAGF